ncbi:MAG: hypothetical protein HYU66_15515 [Armatimonadetes bacterium]|nr:hypothetical protein [Armatimonadota bacterium]
MGAICDTVRELTSRLPQLQPDELFLVEAHSLHCADCAAVYESAEERLGWLNAAPARPFEQARASLLGTAPVLQPASPARPRDPPVESLAAPDLPTAEAARRLFSNLYRMAGDSLRWRPSAPPQLAFAHTWAIAVRGVPAEPDDTGAEHAQLTADDVEVEQPPTLNSEGRFVAKLRLPYRRYLQNGRRLQVRVSVGAELVFTAEADLQLQQGLSGRCFVATFDSSIELPADTPAPQGDVVLPPTAVQLVVLPPG